MTARVLKLPAVLRYVAIFWAFYELFMMFLIAFGSRVVMPGTLVHIATYALAGGAVNVVLTMLLFRALDMLAMRRRGGRTSELALLFVILTVTVVCMLAGDAALSLWFDGVQPSEFTAYSLGLLRKEFHDTLVLVAFLAGLANALRSWAGEDERKIRESELRTAIARAELEAVAAHLRPASVTEALEEIGSVLEHDPARARTLTLQLANSLRASFGREKAESARHLRGDAREHAARWRIG